MYQTLTGYVDVGDVDFEIDVVDVIHYVQFMTSYQRMRSLMHIGNASTRLTLTPKLAAHLTMWLCIYWCHIGVEDELMVTLKTDQDALRASFTLIYTFQVRSRK